jgi:hypothetical protein
MRDNRYHNDEPCCESQSQPSQGGSMSDEPMPQTTQLARNINITPLHYGYMVDVGCQRFAVESVDKLLKYLGEYLKDPQAVEKAWFSGELKLV